MSDKWQVSAGGTIAAPEEDTRLPSPAAAPASAAARGPVMHTSGGYIAEKLWLVVDFLKSSLGKRAPSASPTTSGAAKPVFVDTSRRSDATPTSQSIAQQAAAGRDIDQQLAKASGAAAVADAAPQRDQQPSQIAAAATADKGNHMPIVAQAGHLADRAFKDAAEFSDSTAAHTMHEEMEMDKVRQWADNAGLAHFGQGSSR